MNRVANVALVIYAATIYVVPRYLVFDSLLSRGDK